MQNSAILYGQNGHPTTPKMLRIFNNQCNANFLKSVLVKNFKNQSVFHEITTTTWSRISMPPTFCHTCTKYSSNFKLFHYHAYMQ